MYDIRPLEEEWKKYRKRKRRPWYVGSVIFVLLLLAIVFFFDKNKMNFYALSNYFKTTEKSTSDNEVKHDTIPQETKSNFVVNGPLMHLEVEKKIIDKSEPEVDTSEKMLVDIPILDGSEDEDAPVSKKSRKKIHINVIESTNAAAYKDVKRRFRQSHDTDDSLFLARSYYEKGKYKKSEYWALETNKINPNIEESMLIFVKSKMKLGRKNEAKNILTAYLKKSNSGEAKKLLISIKNGKF